MKKRDTKTVSPSDRSRLLGKRYNEIIQAHELYNFIPKERDLEKYASPVQKRQRQDSRSPLDYQVPRSMLGSESS